MVYLYLSKIYPAFNRLFIVIIALLFIVGCNQHISFNHKPIPAKTAQLVYKNFQQRFLYGDWRFQGLNNENGRIQALIQIPDKLNLSTAQQQAYIKQMICPKVTNTTFWQQLEQHTLEVSLYTVTKTSGINSACRNPLV